MRAFLSVEIGIDKHDCEDTAIFNGESVSNRSTYINADTLQCVAVADGVGGNAGGKLASTFLTNRFSQTDFSQFSAEDLRQFVNNVNTELISHASMIPGKAEMATTLTCVVSINDGYYLIHAGNTRLYVVQGSYLKKITEDHTTYNWLMRYGQLEAAAQCNKSEINCCFGGGNMRYADQLVIDKLSDSCPRTLVLTSDGIHDFVDIDVIEEALMTSKSDHDAAKIIRNTARENGSKDDISIVILRR